MFLELVIIRWIATEIRLFAHLKNLALIACFAGLGIGYGLRRKVIPLTVTFCGLAVLVVWSLPPFLLGWLSLKNLSKYVIFVDVYSWQPANPPAVMIGGIAALLCVFTIIVFMFIPLGQILGDLFRASQNPLGDYTLNVLAGLCGIVFFTLLSVWGVWPQFWFACALVPLLFLLNRRPLHVLLALAALIVALGAQLAVPRVSAMVYDTWSPYQKIRVIQLEAVPAPQGWSLHVGHAGLDAPTLYMLDVNDIAMMWLLDMSPQTLRKYPWLSPKGKIEWYDFPYRIYPRPARVLVIGAGGGNDVAAALRHGAGHVDAVEIDPTIVAIGRRFHPEHPYDNPRVTVHVTDARRYLAANPREKFDVIEFAQLDNTDYNAMSNFSTIRMDSYIYTRECFEQAFRMLKPDGIMAVNFGANDFWGRRTVRLLQDASGLLPRSFRNDLQLRFQGQENSYVLDPSHRLDAACARDVELAAWIRNREAHWQPDLQGPTISDDWPFWFLPQRAIPSLQLLVMAFITLTSIGLIFGLLPSTSRRVDGHFFFLGAAFMLLEVHSITRVALLLGATWLPNAAVISAVLIMIVLANYVVQRWSPRRNLCYGLLGLSLACQLYPVRFLANPSSDVSIVCTLALYALPIFFAGLIFGKSFASSAHADDALRSNLLGAICGGLMECLSYITGMRMLVVFILLLYTASACFGRPRSAV